MSKVYKKIEELGKAINVDGEKFYLVKHRDYMPISVFKADDSFLRIGPENLIKREINQHKKFLNSGFPVSEISAESEFAGNYYYIENSLGKQHFGDIFSLDYNRLGRISDKNFYKFNSLIRNFARAQLKTISQESRLESFYYGIHVDFIIEELPELEDSILEAFDKLQEKTKNLPTVMAHGDLNPHNIFEKGVIDFGSVFDSPAGYDLISNIYHTFLFPVGEKFESQRSYEFSHKQIKIYLNGLDEVYVINKLPKLSRFVDDFIFARTIWSAVRMQKSPNVQAWRYKKFNKILESYLTDNELLSLLI